VLFDHAAARIDATAENGSRRGTCSSRKGPPAKSHIAPSHRGDAAGRGLKRDDIRR
jgi:hypothetical protein